MLKHDMLVAFQESLFLCHIDQKIRIGLIKIMHGHTVHNTRRLYQRPIHPGFLERRMGEYH
jgi:hypothetical protein